MSEQNKELVRQLFKQMDNDDFEGQARLYDENVAYHASGGDEQRGRADVIAVGQGYKAAFPDLKWHEELVVAEGDQVAGRWRAVGTHTGPLGEMPPTGRTVDVTVAANYRFQDGKIVEEWNIYDTADFMNQLGAGG